MFGGCSLATTSKRSRIFDDNGAGAGAGGGSDRSCLIAMAWYSVILVVQDFASLYSIRNDGSATHKVLFYITNGKHKEANC